jgi:hypothetical protein
MRNVAGDAILYPANFTDNNESTSVCKPAERARKGLEGCGAATPQAGPER